MRYKQYLLFFILIGITVLPGFSDQSKFLSDINYSIGTGLSYLNGQYREIVYTKADSANPYLSELLWNLDNIFLLNLTLGASKGPWSINLSASTAITSESGEMTDTDWLDSGSTDNTHWSLSSIWLDKSFLLEVSIAHKFQFSDYLFLPVGLGYKLNFWDWEDKVLAFIYPNPQPIDFVGKNGIDYKVIQNIFYASAGILLTKGNITAGLNIALSPLIYAWDLDHHILRTEAPYFFLDTFLANFWYRTELSVNIKMRSNEELVFTLFREELPEAVGNTYYFDKDPSDPEEVGDQIGSYPNGAGMASLLWGMQLSYIWTF